MKSSELKLKWPLFAALCGVSTSQAQVFIITKTVIHKTEFLPTSSEVKKNVRSLSHGGTVETNMVGVTCWQYQLH